MLKRELRQKYSHFRTQLSLEQRENMSLNIANNLLKLNIWDKSIYHIFLSILEKNEVNTEYLIHILQGKDKNIVISQCEFSKRILNHYLLTDATIIKKNKWGIPEPQGGIAVQDKDIEVVFVPLMAYDTKGNRVGYGKGIYDTFLAQCTPNTLKIGLSFFEPETQDIQDVEPTDISLNIVVTPKNIHKF